MHFGWLRARALIIWDRSFEGGFGESAITKRAERLLKLAIPPIKAVVAESIVP